MQRKLKVGLVCTAPLDAPGSMSAYAETVGDALTRHAPDIEAYLLRIGGPAQAGWAQRLETLTLPLRAWSRRSLAPDVWHVLDGSRAYVSAVLRGAPVVVTAHDLIPWLQVLGRFPGGPRPGFAARQLWRMNAWSLRRASLVVCDSRSTQRDLLDCFRVEEGCTQVVPLPLRPSLEKQLSDCAPSEREAGLILHVGNNGFYKWREQALRAFAALDTALARRLVLLGPPPTSSMQALTSELGIASRVEWLADPCDAVLAAHYRRAALLLFPSRYEGYGWPVLEAMAFGLPVVCSNRGSLPEVAGQACICVDPEDLHAVTAAADRMLRDADHARERAQAGRERAAAFVAEGFAFAMRSIYRRAAKARRSGAGRPAGATPAEGVNSGGAD